MPKQIVMVMMTVMVMFMTVVTVIMFLRNLVIKGEMVAPRHRSLVTSVSVVSFMQSYQFRPYVLSLLGARQYSLRPVLGARAEVLSCFWSGVFWALWFMYQQSRPPQKLQSRPWFNLELTGPSFHSCVCAAQVECTKL